MIFTTTLSSGPFLVAPTALSVDWAVINGSDQLEMIRVTVYKWGIGVPKAALPPGALTESLAPGTVFHNANSVPSVFAPGFYYEVVVELTGPDLLPNVTQWSSQGAGDFIPGTLIPAGSFVKVK